MGYKCQKLSLKQSWIGQNPNIPGIEEDDVPTFSDYKTSETVAKHLNAIYSARREQLKAEAAARIKRALEHQTREIYSEEIKNNDLVFYKRDGDNRWRGPGSVIDQLMEN